MATQDPIDAEGHARIEAAVREAEKRTSGEIYCVLARASDGYFYPAMFTVTVMLMGLSVAAAFALSRSWEGVPHLTLVAAQAAAFACAWALVGLVPAIRPMLVPRALLHRRAHENALRQFLSHNIHLTEERTGVLIFVSLAERYAEIIADSGIAERVEQDEWDDAMASLTAAARDGRLAEGFVGTIESAGRLLAENFPPRAQNRNELADRLVEI